MNPAIHTKNKSVWFASFLIVLTAATVFGGRASAQTSVSRTQADQIALRTVPGSTLAHTSADTMKGKPVWDVHVSLNGQIWDVKVNVSNGVVVLKRLSNEKQSSANGGSNSRSSSESHDRQNSRHGGSVVTTSVDGVVFGQKLTTVPPAYQIYVNQALAKVGGTLKWVKFSRKDGVDIQMNIKIKKNSGGTTKVKDVFLIH